MSKKRFVQLIEKVKKGHAWVYDGVVVAETKTEITVICQGPEKSSKIARETFLKSEYQVEEVSVERVKHLFKTAIFHREKELLEAEFELDDCKYALERQKQLAKDVFGEVDL